MQQDFDLNFPSLDIQIVGVNERGHESANASVTNGRDLPWLQDVDANSNGQSDVWYDLWNIVYRDVVILDRDNSVHSVYNLTTNDLGVPAKYQTLRNMMLNAAAVPPTSQWQHPIEPLDVDGNQLFGPLDALIVINNLNVYPDGVLPVLGAGQTPPYYLDTNGNGSLGPIDALLVINKLPSSTSQAALGPVRAPLASAAATSEGNNSLATEAPLASLSPNEFANVDAIMAELHTSHATGSTDIIQSLPVIQSNDTAIHRSSVPMLQLLNHRQHFGPFLFKQSEHRNDNNAGDDSANVPQPRLLQINRRVPDDREQSQYQERQAQEQKRSNTTSQSGEDSDQRQANQYKRKPRRLGNTV